MKKIILIIALALMPVLMNAAPREKKAGVKNTAPSELISLINQYSPKGGFEVVKVGSMGMSLAKPILRMVMDSSDPDQKMVLDMVRGIKKIAVVNYAESEDEVKTKFVSKVERILSEDNLLMNASDGEDCVKIYGFVSGDGSTMKDFVLHSPSEGALVCLFGTISIDAIASMVSNYN